MNIFTSRKTLAWLSILFALCILGTESHWRKPPTAAALAVDSPAGLSKPEAELVRISSDIIHTQNQLLVGGSVTAALRRYPRARRWQQFDRNALDALVKRRAYLQSYGQGYKSFVTELALGTAAVDGDTAAITLTEHSVFYLSAFDTDAAAPETTEFYQEHQFAFVRERGRWLIESHRVLDESAQTTIAGTHPVEPLPFEGKTKRDIEEDYRQFQRSGATAGSTESGDLALEPAPLVPQALQATLNRASIVSYAYQYWSNYNSAYRSFSGNDCTNFVSQAVRAGGWPFVSGLYTSSSYWWYNSLNQTHTWINAHKWALFTYNRPRGYLASRFSDLQPGDILQMDFQRDGTIDHTMVVTKKDNSGTIYLTYHTTNTKDKSIWTIVSGYPNAVYYAWRLFGTYN